MGFAKTPGVPRGYPASIIWNSAVLHFATLRTTVPENGDASPWMSKWLQFVLSWTDSSPIRLTLKSQKELVLKFPESQQHEELWNRENKIPQDRCTLPTELPGSLKPKADRHNVCQLFQGKGSQMISGSALLRFSPDSWRRAPAPTPPSWWHRTSLQTGHQRHSEVALPVQLSRDGQKNARSGRWGTQIKGTQDSNSLI